MLLHWKRRWLRNEIFVDGSGSGFHYWELVNEHLFDGAIIVESKGSNQKLLDAVRALHPMDGDINYIAFDIVYDNMDIMNKYLELKELVNKYPDRIILLLSLPSLGRPCWNSLCKWLSNTSTRQW